MSESIAVRLAGALQAALARAYDAVTPDEWEEMAVLRERIGDSAYNRPGGIFDRVTRDTVRSLELRFEERFPPPLEATHETPGPDGGIASEAGAVHLHRALVPAWELLGSLSDEQLARLVGEFDLNLPFGEQLAQVLELNLDDLFNLLLPERVENHNFIHAVQEFGPKMVKQCLVNSFL